MTRKNLRSTALPFALTLALLLGAPAAFSATPAPVIDAGFEGGKSPDAVTDQLAIAADTTRAHSGKASLKMTSQKKGAWGNLTFALDGKLDFTANHELSVWFYTETAATRVSAYITADDGSGEPYTIVHATGTIEPGKWCRLSGTINADYWRKNDRDFKLIVRTRGTCWVDDLKLTGGLPETPGQVWPKLEPALHAAAGKRVTTLAPGGALTLDARNAALAPDTGRVETTLPSAASAIVPADGLLVFAIDAKDDLELTGSIEIEPDANLQPGLRVAVLSDDTVIAAPGVRSAAPWRATPGVGNRPGPTPDIQGIRPPATVALNTFRMTKGRHYITVAGPHMRGGGTFAKLQLRANPRPAEKPLYTFAFLSDTHLGFGRITKGHSKINSSTAEQLEATLRQLKREGAAFAILGGDMTDNGRRSQFEDLARVVKRAGLPVYGCIGNHDTFRDSRKDIAETLAPLFPDGAAKTDYAFSRPPLRFVVLDGSYWRGKGVPIQGFRGGRADQMTYREDMPGWLRDTLAKDTVTPTIVISHYQFYLRHGVSTVSGYNLGKNPTMNKDLMAVLDAAPNVVATMNGHHHSNAVANYRGITTLQNPAVATWPNAYRVCRVFAGRIEWEVRQIPNRGLIRESANAKMKLLWPLSVYDDDLAGTISLAPRKPAAK